MGNEDRDFDLEIEQSLKENSNWSGSPAALWEQIAVKLPPKRPWWDRHRTWMMTAAAAMIGLAVLLPNLPWQSRGPHPSPILPRTAPRVETMDRPETMSLFMAPIEQPGEEQVLDIPEVRAGKTHEIRVELAPVMFFSALEEGADDQDSATRRQDNTTTLPSLRLIRLDDQGGQETVTERVLESWTDLGVTFPTAEEGIHLATVSLEVPMEPGMYVLEITGEVESKTEDPNKQMTLSGQTTFIVR